MKKKAAGIIESVGTVVITGGSSGIGECFICRLKTLRGDLRICNISRSKPELDFADSPIYHIGCDLGKRDQLEAAAEEAIAFAKEGSGGVLLINNSGFGCYGRFPAPGLAETLDMIRVNAEAPVHLTGLMLPLLRERGGCVVNVASTAAFQPTPYLTTYGATKAFLLHWSLSLGEDLRRDGVHVLAVCPGPTSTRFFKRAGFDKPMVSDRVGQTSEQVVEETLRALRKGKRLVVTGWLNRLMVANASRLPRPLAARISEIVLRRYRMEKLG